MISFSLKKVVALTSASALALVSAPSAFAAPATHSVLYRVTGLEGASAASVSYKTSRGETSAGTVSLPWSASFPIHVGGDQGLEAALGLYVSRPESEQGESGLYACEIWVDGTLREKVERDLDEGSLVCFLGDDDSDEVEG